MAARSPTLVTVTEASAELGVSDATVWRMIRGGELRSIIRGGRRLIFRKSLSERTIRTRTSNRVPPLTADHPIFRMIGAGRAGGRKPGAREKHEILAR